MTHEGINGHNVGKLMGKVDLRKGLVICSTLVSKHRLNTLNAEQHVVIFSRATCLLCHDCKCVENVFEWLQTQMGSRYGGGTCVDSASRPWMAQLGALSPLQTEVTGPLRSGVI